MSKHPLLLTILATLGLFSSVFGVGTVTNGTYSYNITEPTTISNYTSEVITTGSYWNPPSHSYVVQSNTTTQTSSVNFSSGWGTTSGVTGWDYVGAINGASAVYLGDGWVITCNHVLSVTDYSRSFTLSGSTYSIAEGSITKVGSSDLVMFYIGSSIDLPSLSLNTTTFAYQVSLVLVGNGGGAESYGVATLTSYATTQISGTSTAIAATSTSTSLVVGDSGGAAYYYDSNSKTWVLAGVLEAVGSSTNGSTVTYSNYSVDIATYSTAIENIMASAVPEPSTLVLAGAGLGALWWMRRKHKNRPA